MSEKNALSRCLVPLEQRFRTTGEIPEGIVLRPAAERGISTAS